MCIPYGCISLSGILQLYDADRNTIHEEQDIRTAILLTLFHHELVYTAEYISIRMFEVDIFHTEWCTTIVAICKVVAITIQQESAALNARIANHTQVRRRQYDSAPAGIMPPEMRLANARHMGVRPGSSDPANIIAKTALNIPGSIASHRLAGLTFDVVGQRLHGIEDLLVVGGVGREGNPELLLHRHAKLQCIDGVQPQPLAEQRHLGFDVGRREVFEIEGRHHDLLQLVFNVIPVHVAANYIIKPLSCDCT